MTIRLVQGETGEGRYRGGDGGHGAISWEQMIGLFPVPSDHEYCLGIVRLLADTMFTTPLRLQKLIGRSQFLGKRTETVYKRYTFYEFI